MGLQAVAAAAGALCSARCEDHRRAVPDGLSVCAAASSARCDHHCLAVPDGLCLCAGLSFVRADAQLRLC